MVILVSLERLLANVDEGFVSRRWNAIIIIIFADRSRVRGSILDSSFLLVCLGAFLPFPSTQDPSIRHVRWTGSRTVVPDPPARVLPLMVQEILCDKGSCCSPTSCFGRLGGQRRLVKFELPDSTDKSRSPKVLLN